jgi:hypothetical protein
MSPSYSIFRVVEQSGSLSPASPPTARIALFGTRASGSADYTITDLPQFVRQFGAIQVWMGYPRTGYSTPPISSSRNPWTARCAPGPTADGNFQQIVGTR